MRSREMIVRLDRLMNGVPERRTRPDYDALPPKDRARARLLYGMNYDVVCGAERQARAAGRVTDDSSLDERADAIVEVIENTMSRAQFKAWQRDRHELAELERRAPLIDWPAGHYGGPRGEWQGEYDWLFLPREWDEYWTAEVERDDRLPGGFSSRAGRHARVRFFHLPMAGQQQLWALFLHHGWDGDFADITRDSLALEHWSRWPQRGQRLLFRCLEAADDTPSYYRTASPTSVRAAPRPALNGLSRGPVPARGNGNGKGYGLDPAMRLHEGSDPPARLTKH